MGPKAALWTSITGTTIVALCCFTPVLVVILTTIGLSAWIGYLDYVLLPALGALIGLSLWSYMRYRRQCQRHR
ncbi:MAG: mercury resistance system transport protein MerF [Elainellaceae cyanobacterium]